jgi:3-deoxy-D-manno-octulosonic-acid transferase
MTGAVLSADWAGAALSAGWAGSATLLAPALRVHLRRRCASGKEIAARLGERFGRDPTARPAGRLIWVHAASVGEAASVLPVLAVLAERATVLVTTGTVTSQALLERRLAEAGLGGRVLQRFAPLDVPAWVDRFLSHWRPDAAAFVESELWPNQLAACRARGIPLMLVNARMSERSFDRWRRVPGLARRVLGGFALVQARSEQDGDRLRGLGAGRVDSPGDLKFAAPPLPVDVRELERLRALLAGRPVWLAASTHPGEEALVAKAHAMLAAAHPGLVTIVAPRHPERGAALAAELGATRRGAGEGPAGVWIADTLMELGLWYRLASVAFVGRSLLPPGGGQNPLEPARLGCAIAVGPHTGNFTDHVALLRDAGGLVDIADTDGLARFAGAMLDDPGRAQRLGERAQAAVLRHQDLPARTADALLSLLAA